MIEKIGPIHDLIRIQELVGVYTPSGGVLAKAERFVNATRRETIPIVRELIRSLEPDDFLSSHQEFYGEPIWLDDYAKIDGYGLWFAKLGIKKDGTLLICSCHESRDDEVRLRNGNVLRRPEE